MDMHNTSLIILAWELFQQGVNKSDIARHLSRDRETIRIWVSGVEKLGLMEFLDHYEGAKKGERKRRQIDSRIKPLVWRIREEEEDCCGQKIAYFLKKDFDISLSVPKIYEILKEKYQIRSKWKKNKQRGPVPHPQASREVVQMDTIDLGGLFAFTAIDCFSREADVLVAPELTSGYGYRFLAQSMDRRFNSHVRLIQTDGGSEFKDQFTDHVDEFCDRHRVSRPYKKNEQSFIESFNRTVRKECLGWTTYHPDQIDNCQHLVETFLNRYHYHRPHMGLGMRPPLNKIT